MLLSCQRIDTFVFRSLHWHVTNIYSRNEGLERSTFGSNDSIGNHLVDTQVAGSLILIPVSVIGSFYISVVRCLGCVRNILSQKYHLNGIFVCVDVKFINLQGEAILRVSIAISLNEVPQLVPAREVELCELKHVL